MVGSAIVFLFFSNSLIAEKMMNTFESEPQKLYTSYKWGIVLGGYATLGQNKNQTQFNSGSDRILQAIQLQRSSVIKNILFSGGSKYGDDPSSTETVILRNYLEQAGLFNENIFFEGFSSNTHENALKCKELMPSKAIQDTIVLITSAYHGKRAKATFEKQGFKIQLYPVDYLNKKPQSFLYYITPQASALQTWNCLIHEYVGFWSYKLLNYA